MRIVPGACRVAVVICCMIMSGCGSEGGSGGAGAPAGGAAQVRFANDAGGVITVEVEDTDITAVIPSGGYSIWYTVAAGEHWYVVSGATTARASFVAKQGVLGTLTIRPPTASAVSGPDADETLALFLFDRSGSSAMETH